MALFVLFLLAFLDSILFICWFGSLKKGNPVDLEAATYLWLRGFSFVYMYDLWMAINRALAGI